MDKATISLNPVSPKRIFPIAPLKAAQKENETPIKPPIVIDTQYLDKETVLNKHSEGVDYLISQKLIIRSRLIIEPGVVIAFTKDAGFEFRNKGVLKAVGTTDASIIFRGVEEDHGYWRGLFFNNNTAGNIMEFCHVLHAGGRSFDGMHIHANLRLKSKVESGSLSLAHCSFNEGAGDGIYVGSGNYSLQRFHNITAQYNLRAPLSLEAGVLGVLDGLNSILNYNGMNYVEVRGGRVFGKCNIKDAGIPYLFRDVTMVGYGACRATMTIDEGVEIKFAGNAQLVVSSQGSLFLHGSKDDPIRLFSKRNKNIPVSSRSIKTHGSINFYWYAAQAPDLSFKINSGYMKKPLELSGNAEQIIVLGELLKDKSPVYSNAKLKQDGKFRLAS